MNWIYKNSFDKLISIFLAINITAIIKKLIIKSNEVIFKDWKQKHDKLAKKTNKHI